MFSTSNIIKGPAELYVDGINVGWTQGGARLRVTKELWYRPSRSGIGEQESVKLNEMFYVSATLVETTLDNLRRAFGFVGSIEAEGSDTRLYYGGSPVVQTRQVQFVTEDKVVTFYKVVAIDFGELVFGRGPVLIPCNFKCLLDITAAKGRQFGYIQNGVSKIDSLRKLVARVSIIVGTGTSDAVSRLTVLKESTLSAATRINILKESSSSVLMRTTIYQPYGITNFVARVTVTQGWLTSKVVSQVTVTS